MQINTINIPISNGITEEMAIEILRNEPTDVRAALDYYFTMDKEVLPINDKGWMKFGIKTRLRAAELIDLLTL